MVSRLYPDVLEARSATAQAEYDLQSALGAEEIARGDLATAVGTPASVAIRFNRWIKLPTPDSISETVEETINRAFAQRPDLMQQAAEIRTAHARLKEDRAAYYSRCRSSPMYATNDTALYPLSARMTGLTLTSRRGSKRLGPP